MQQEERLARPFAPRWASGFTLIEVLLALFLLAIGLLAAAPMFVYGKKVGASSADIGKLGASAVQKLESLRQTDFASLPPGGSLTLNAAGYSDTSDPAVRLRWTIADDTIPPTPPRYKTITIVATSTRLAGGMGPKTVRFMTKRTV